MFSTQFPIPNYRFSYFLEYKRSMEAPKLTWDEFKIFCLKYVFILTSFFVILIFKTTLIYLCSNLYTILVHNIYIYLFTRHQSSGAWASPSNFKKWKSCGGKKMFTLADSDEPQSLQWKWGGYGRGGRSRDGHGRGGHDHDRGGACGHDRDRDHDHGGAY